MEDADLVAVVAAEYVRRRRGGALRYLRDQQMIAEEAGDALSAEAWGDIADTAETMLFGANCAPPGSRA